MYCFKRVFFKDLYIFYIYMVYCNRNFGVGSYKPCLFYVGNLFGFFLNFKKKLKLTLEIVLGNLCLES
jgi:hypothetical protein